MGWRYDEETDMISAVEHNQDTIDFSICLLDYYDYYIHDETNIEDNYLYHINSMFIFHSKLAQS